MLLFGLLVITVSLIKLESVVSGEQCIGELCYLVPPVVILPPLATKLNPHYITGFVDGEGSYFIPPGSPLYPPLSPSPLYPYPPLRTGRGKGARRGGGGGGGKGWGISADSKFSTGYKIKVSFQIGLHEVDCPLLELIKASLAVGKLTKQGQESIQYRVHSIKELKVIISHLSPRLRGGGTKNTLYWRISKLTLNYLNKRLN